MAEYRWPHLPLNSVKRSRAACSVAAVEAFDLAVDLGPIWTGATMLDIG